MIERDLVAVEETAEGAMGRQGEGPEAQANGAPQLFLVGTAIRLVQGGVGPYADHGLWRTWGR